MAFWKKSEDPWDVDPDKRRPTVREESAENNPDAVSHADAPQAGAEGSQAEENREAPAAPMRCPWCGREMELGYLYSKECILWVDQEPGAFLGVLSAGKELYVSDEGVTTEYKSCWYCSTCGRLVIQMTGQGRPSSEECRDEFRRYAEQAKGRK